MAAQNDFEQHFADLSDVALMEINRDDLVASAKAVYDREMERRGLKNEQASAAPGGAPEANSGDLVSLVEFDSLEDAGHALTVLQENKIPAFISIAVPREFAQQSLRLLDPGVPEEELEKLAEEAGNAG